MTRRVNETGRGLRKEQDVSSSLVEGDLSLVASEDVAGLVVEGASDTVVARSQPLGDAAVVGDVDGGGGEGVGASVEGASAGDVVLVQDGAAVATAEEAAEVVIVAAANTIDAGDGSPDLS